MAEAHTSSTSFCDFAPFSAEAQGLSLRFLPGGKDRLEALLALIDGARSSLELAFYIFATDRSATQVRDALTAAARRGVDVRLIVDGFGALADEKFFAPLTEAGGTFCCFMAKLTRRYLIRNHQKIVVADGRVAMIGGFNVEDSYFTPPETGGWSDLAVTVEGSAVGELAQKLRVLDRVSRLPVHHRPGVVEGKERVLTLFVLGVGGGRRDPRGDDERGDRCRDETREWSPHASQSR